MTYLALPLQAEPAEKVSVYPIACLVTVNSEKKMKAEFSDSRCPFLISSPLPPCPLMSVKGHNSVWRSWWRKAVACGLELRERGYPRMKYKPYHIDFPFGGPDITPSISL